MHQISKSVYRSLWVFLHISGVFSGTFFDLPKTSKVSTADFKVDAEKLQVFADDHKFAIIGNNTHVSNRYNFTEDEGEVIQPFPNYDEFLLENALSASNYFRKIGILELCSRAKYERRASVLNDAFDYIVTNMFNSTFRPNMLSWSSQSHPARKVLKLIKDGPSLQGNCRLTDKNVYKKFVKILIKQLDVDLREHLSISLDSIFGHLDSIGLEQNFTSELASNICEITVVDPKDEMSICVSVVKQLFDELNLHGRFSSKSRVKRQGFVGPAFPGVGPNLLNTAPSDTVIVLPQSHGKDHGTSGIYGSFGVLSLALLGVAGALLLQNKVFSAVAEMSVGPAGPNGGIGDAGMAGTNGSNGNKGIKGTAGARGDMGPKGLRGAIGMKGKKGVKGMTGMKGLKGARGMNGQKGPMGMKGLKGAKGMRGLKGERGYKGDMGEQGEKCNPAKCGPGQGKKRKRRNLNPIIIEESPDLLNYLFEMKRNYREKVEKDTDSLASSINSIWRESKISSGCPKCHLFALLKNKYQNVSHSLVPTIFSYFFGNNDALELLGAVKTAQKLGLKTTCRRKGATCQVEPFYKDGKT